MLTYDDPYAIEGLETMIPLLTTLRYWATPEAGTWFQAGWLILASLFFNAVLNSSHATLPLGALTLGCAPLDLP